MKEVLRCMRCRTVFPLELGTEWGRSQAADGMGRDPRCPAMLPAPHAPPAVDPFSGEKQVPEELCRGVLNVESVSDSTPVEDIGKWGAGAVRETMVWRQAKQGK